MSFHIFFATDGSVSARFAQAQIVLLPWRPPVHVTAMTAMEIPHAPFTSLLPAARRAYDTALSALRDDAESNATEVLAKTRRVLEGRVASVGTRMHTGYAGATIVETARACRADLVAVGSRGLGPYKGILLGSVSNHVAQFAAGSVLVAKTPPKRRARLLVALSGAAGDRETVGWLKCLDLSEGSRIHLLKVRRQREPADDERFTAWTETGGALEAAGCDALPAGVVQATAEVRCGHEVSEIEDAIHEFRPDLLILGATAWAPAPDSPLSNVTWKLVNQAPCSTVIVRP
jgi:nucleotide-binding universal stress UspA family protein